MKLFDENDSGSMGEKFPGVELVPEIRLKEHPLGRYIWDKKHIQLSREELVGRSSDDRRFALYHELGHWWHSENIPDLTIEADQEEFASAFAFYFVSPEKLDRRARVYFHSCFTGGQDARISHFAEEIFVHLDELLG